MLELKRLDSKTDVLRPDQPSPPARKQQRLMVVALSLLLVTLAFVLYRDRGFWFPEAPEAGEQPPPASPVATTAVPANSAHSTKATRARGRQRRHKASIVQAAAPDTGPPAEPVTVNRTVLPPLEVEVVAGASHRVLQPGTNSVRIEMQGSSPGPPQVPAVAANDQGQTAASVTSQAADRVQVSPGTADVVASSVTPDYPMLARQMQVEGSVILQALISRDGLIQDLRVLSGPPILAKAAQEAVRQWHFKPHYDSGTAVETQAKITVNFTISTN